jgi:hypothetical protein
MSTVEPVRAGKRQEPGNTRRDVLRKAAAIGLGASALLVAGEALTATPAAAESGNQSNWRFCAYCKNLVYGVSTGPCMHPATDMHDGSSSWNYSIHFEDWVGGPVAGYQDLWSYCVWCYTMFYRGGTSYTNGHCPSGGPHNGVGSFNYNLRTGGNNPGQWQDGWQYCKNCTSLFFGPYQGESACSAYPSGTLLPHDGSGSFDYWLLYSVS